MGNQPLNVSKATVGIAFVKRNIVDPKTNEEHPVQIWDTAGQEKFQSVTTHHYRAADGALLVFDMTNEASFRNLDRWLNELHENTEPSLRVTLVGAKGDLANARVVSEERAKAYAQSNGLMYAETSAMWDKHASGRGVVMGIERIFANMVTSIVHQQAEASGNPSRLDVSGYGLVKGMKLGADDTMKAACDC